MILTGENFDALVQMYAHIGILGGYELREGLPAVTLTVARSRGGVQVEGEPALSAVQGLDYDYLFSEDTLWRLQRPGCTRILPALQALGGKSLFFIKRRCHRLLQLCAAGAGQQAKHRGPGTPAAEPDPAGASGAVLSGCAGQLPH